MRISHVFCRPSPLILILSFIFAASFAAAQNGDEDEECYITALSISGLKRTKLSTAERPLLKFINLKADEVDPDDVKAAVLATGIMDPLSVETEGQVLSIEVREKWAIFPIPVVMAGSEGLIAGLAFFDANAFGLNDKLFLAGIYFVNGWAVTSGYIHSSPGGHVPGWNGMAAFNREERFDRDQRNKDLRRFALDEISLSAGLSFPLLGDTDLLSASVLASFNSITLRESEKVMNKPEEDLRMSGAGGSLSVRKDRWDGYLLSQETASLRYYFRTNFSGLSYHSIRLRGTLEKSLVPGFRLNLRGGLVYEPGVPVLFESSPQAAQVAILPRYFSARHYAGISAGLEKYLLKFSSGTLSLAAAYQLVYSSGSILGASLDHGVTGMLTFYLSQLAIPALGLGAAYNVKENYLQASFNLGMSF